MASDVDIANLALMYLGAQPIVAFTDQNEGARVMNRAYPLMRDKLLRAFRWNFTVVYTQLAALSTPPPMEFSYAYQLPSDFISLEVANCGVPNGPNTSIPPASQPPFNGIGLPTTSLADYNTGRTQDYRIVANGVLYSQWAPPLGIIYRARVTDPTRFDPAFVDAFATFLAVSTARQITGSGEIRQEVHALYKEAIAAALAAKTIETPPLQVPDDTWMLARISS